MADSHNAAQKLMLKYPRPIGALLLLLGGGVFYESIVKPIQQAQAGAPEITIWQMGGVIAIALVIIGLTYTLFGAKFAKLFHPSSEESRAPSVIVSIVLAAVGLGAYFALETYLKGQGYVFMN